MSRLRRCKRPLRLPLKLTISRFGNSVLVTGISRPDYFDRVAVFRCICYLGRFCRSYRKLYLGCFACYFGTCGRLSHIQSNLGCTLRLFIQNFRQRRLAACRDLFPRCSTLGFRIFELIQSRIFQDFLLIINGGLFTLQYIFGRVCLYCSGKFHTAKGGFHCLRRRKVHIELSAGICPDIMKAVGASFNACFFNQCIILIDTGQIRCGVINRVILPVFWCILLPRFAYLFPAINDRSRYKSIRLLQTDRSTRNRHISLYLCITTFSHPNMCYFPIPCRFFIQTYGTTVNQHLR